MDLYHQQPPLVEVTCSHCGEMRMTIDPKPLCSFCEQREIIGQISPELWVRIDSFIRQKQKIEATRLLKERMETSLQHAMAIVAERALELEQS